MVSPPADEVILLIEDDAMQARFLQLQLMSFNYRVETVEHLGDVPAALAQHAPALVLMDIGFPEGRLAGPEMLIRLKESGVVLPPVVYLSATAEFTARLAAVRGGGVAHFVKPVDIGRLADRIDVLLGKREHIPYRVLIVEDSPSMAAFYAKVLETAGMDARIVTDPLKATDALADFQAELILMDMHMPGCSGLELSRVLRLQDQYVSIPIVFLSAEADLGKHQEAMRVGGDDFLMKPIEPERLVESVTTRADRYRVLRNFMLRDGLTGLYNHSTTAQQLDVEIARAQRQKTPLTVAMVDIDFFKKVNDTYGHPVGDQVIRSLSRLLQQRLRKSDMVGRFGGEEFVAILPDTPGEAALAVMDAIRAAFSEIKQYADAKEFSSTFSCGVASLGAVGELPLLEAADQALYESKRGGRNRVTLFSQSP